MDKPQERTLHQYGDRELWHADADDGSWMLPLFVEWRHDKESDLHFAHVTPAGICLYYKQALALNALFQVHDIMGRKNEWVIPRRICEAILRKAPGITPLRYYKWPEPDCPPIESKPAMHTAMNGKGNPTRAKEVRIDPLRRSFVEWLAKERKISASIINAVLNAVAAEAPSWMLEHRKPLDLGFVRLVAVPFRANWKEIVAFKAKCRGIKLRTLFNEPDDRRWTLLEECGLPEMMTSPHNVGLRRGWKNETDVARIDYTIESIASDQFEAAANRIEGQRMARGAAAYVAEFEDAVEEIYKSAVQALRAYLKKVAMPLATVGKGSNESFLGFLPIVGRRVQVRGTSLDRLPVHIVPSGSRFSVFGKDDPRLLPAPPTEVQSLPPVPPEHVDLRECTIDGHLELLTDGASDATRMLVRNEPKVETGGSELFSI